MLNKATVRTTIVRYAVIPLCFLLLVSQTCFAFLYDMEILDPVSISKLTNEALIEKYVDVTIEVQATRTFHIAAGFSGPKDYRQHKELLRYRIHLMFEIQKRELQIPDIDH